MAGLFTVISGVLMIASIAIYLVRLFRGVTTLNPVTWVINAIAMTLNNLTFNDIVRGNAFENVPGLLVNASFFLIVAHAFIKGHAKLVRGDVYVFILAAAIGMVWWISGDAFIANVALQVIFLISFWPTFIGLLEGRRDHPIPWLLAVASYGFQILTIVTNRPDWTWHSLVFPVVNGLFGNGSIAFAAWRRNIQLQAQAVPSPS